ncbi:MAG: hypothetical protein U1F43_26215 [Myxococcota bacterium]
MPFMPSPAAIPLLSCEASRVDRSQEREFKLDRFGRGHGFIFGNADLWRFHLVLEAPAKASLETGWCLSAESWSRHSPSTPISLAKLIT